MDVVVVVFVVAVVVAVVVVVCVRLNPSSLLLSEFRKVSCGEKRSRIQVHHLSIPKRVGRHM